MLKYLSILAVFACLLHSCEKDEMESIVGKLDETAYYSSEIFPDEYLKIYGLWKYTYLHAGWGGEQSPDFDHLEIVRYGIYAKIKNGKIIEYGRIELVPIQEQMIYPVNFIPDPRFTQAWGMVILVEFREDKLILADYVCDGHYREFTRR